MTQDEIIEMAIQAELNLYVHDLTEKRYIEVIEAFAKLVAEKEREECAKEADKRLHDYTMLLSNPPQNGAAWSIAIAIRARGQA
jgi:hypothetical protein